MSYHIQRSPQPRGSPAPAGALFPSVPEASTSNLILLGLGIAFAFMVLRPTKKRANPSQHRWVAGAVKHPGALTAAVKRRYGARGFTRSARTGRMVIKRSVLSELSREPGKTGQRARLAITMRGFRRR